jgi:hypothetical protein
MALAFNHAGFLTTQQQDRPIAGECVAAEAIQWL